MDCVEERSSRLSSRKKEHNYLYVCWGFLLACLLGVTLEIFFFSPISPDYSLPLLPPSTSTTAAAAADNSLQGVIKVGEGLVKDPEDVWVEKKTGTAYTASRDGWIKRFHRNGSWEDWRMITGGAHTLLGLATTSRGNLIVCDVQQGLLSVEEDGGVTVLASHLSDGTKIRFADEVIAASDGSLYFSVASTKFGLDDWFLDVLEARHHGQLLKYDPSLHRTTLLLDHLYFANGVALSPEEDYLIVCETTRHRCLKYWLKGKSKGQTEVFIDNLPGKPDNINLAPDGSYWIALIQCPSRRLEFVQKYKALRHLLATFPWLCKRVISLHEAAMVVNVASDGKIVKILQDPTGKVMSFVTSALEFEDHLYLGSLNSNFVGKLPL